MTDTEKVPSPLVFVDTETTGLDAEQHEIWEVAAIIGDFERRWFLPVDLGRADPVALKIGGYHKRHPHGYDYDGDRGSEWVTPRKDCARAFADITRGAHLVGAVPSFDEERLRKLLRANGACPEWHYHLIDVEAMMIGYLRARSRFDGDVVMIGERDGETASLSINEITMPPWKSRDLSWAVGVDPDDPRFDPVHTAITDARWVKAIYEKIMGGAA